MLGAIVLIVVLSFALAYLGTGLSTTSLILLAAILLIALIPGHFSTALILLVIIGPLLFLLNSSELRQSLISKRVLAIFRETMPPLSATEREAMLAGDTWWDAELFTGKPDWRKLLGNPAPKLSDREQAFLNGPVETLCDMLDDWDITHKRRDLPPEVWEYIRKERFFGMIIPRQYGGLEFSALAHSEVVMKIATRSITAAVTVMVPNSLGPGALLLKYGTEAQKEYYLPRLASGEEIPCFGLTGPHSGSDAGAMPDNGIVCKQDFDGHKNVLGIRLNWQKRYITLGPVATLLGLAFRLYDPKHLLGEIEDIGITLALIPTDTEGVEIGRRHLPLDIPFQNGPNSGHNVFIPMDWLIGGQDFAGKGWGMLMECLAEGRGVSLPALSTGAAKFASRTTGAYATIRQQFKLPIGRFEGVQEALGRIGGLTYLADAARTLTLSALDQHIHPSVITAILKLHLTENMRRVIDDAMDIHAGKGIMLGPNNYLARIYQSIPISITVEGANILTRNMIIFGQGAIRCHPFILDEMEAAADTGERALERFDSLLFRHLGFVLSNLSRSLLLGLSTGRLLDTPGNTASRLYYQQLSRFSAALALVADISMALLGGQLKRRESISARLGDVLSHLYLGSAVLKRFQDQGQRERDKPLMHWASKHCLYRIQDAFDQLLNNYPNRRLGQVLRFFVFPFGRCLKAPGDDLNRQVAQILMHPSAVRDRLTAGIFQPAEGEAVGLLEQAFLLSEQAEPLEHRLREAARAGTLEESTNIDQAVTAGILTNDESALLRRMRELRNAIIRVDDFAREELA